MSTIQSTFMITKHNPSNDLYNAPLGCDDTVKSRLNLMRTSTGSFRTFTATVEKDGLVRHLTCDKNFMVCMGKYPRLGNVPRDEDSLFGDPEGKVRAQYKGLITDHSILTAREDERKMIYRHIATYFNTRSNITYLEEEWRLKTKEHLNTWMLNNNRNICLAEVTGHLASAQTIQCVLGYKDSVEVISRIFQTVTASSIQRGTLAKLYAGIRGLFLLKKPLAQFWRSNPQRGMPIKTKKHCPIISLQKILRKRKCSITSSHSLLLDRKLSATSYASFCLNLR